MKYSITMILCIISCKVFSQALQLHYDVRHTIDPVYNTKNFMTIYFEYFKNEDSGKSFIKPGSFLLKMQTDFTEDNSNEGKFYMQISQSFRLWNPKVFISLQYSGGLGLTEPKQYSYYITNTFSAGIAYPFSWHKAYLSSILYYKYVPYKKASNDFLYTMYWWKGFWNYKAEFSGDFSIWTENKNHGDDYTSAFTGKRFFFFAEPQLWYNFDKTFAAGTKINMNYHVLTTDNILQVYPTIAVRWKL